MSASIPKRCVQKYVVKSDCMPGHSASSIRSSSSWKAARSQKHLEGVDKGPMGIRHHKGSPNRFHIKALSGCGSSHSSLHGRSGSPDKGRVKRTPEQRSSSRGNKPSERVLHKSLPGPKKGRRAETRNKPKVPEQFCSDTTLQDGGNPYFEGPDTTRRLVGKSGSEGRLLCSPDPPLSPSIPQIQLPGEVLSVHLPPIWPVIGSLGLYQDPKASISSPPGDESAPNSIHRRHPSPGGVPGTSKESCGGRSLPPTMSWLSDKLKEISAGTSTSYGIPGPDSGHCGHGIETPSGENKKDSCGGTKHGNGRTYLSPCHSKAGGKDECNISCHPTSPTVLSPSTDGTLRSTEQQLSVLRDTGFPLPSQQGGTEVVGQPHGEIEWEITPFQGDRYDNRLRCLPDGLGCSMSKSTDRRSVVSVREPDAYKLPRVVGSHTGSSDISETQNQVVSPPEVGQHLSSGIHKQPGRDSLPRVGSLGEDTMDVVSGTKHPHHSPAPTRCTKPYCRCGVSDNGGSVRLETEPDPVQENCQSLWSNTSRPICIPPDCTVPSLFQLAARSLCSSNRCFSAGLVSDTGICQSSVESNRASPVTGSGATGLYHSGGTSLEDTTLVPTTSRYAEGIPLSDQTLSDNVLSLTALEKLQDTNTT